MTDHLHGSGNSNQAEVQGDRLMKGQECQHTSRQTESEQQNIQRRNQAHIPRLGLNEKQTQQLHQQHARYSLYEGTCICQDMDKNLRGPEASCFDDLYATCSNQNSLGDCRGDHGSCWTHPTCGCVQGSCTCSARVDDLQECTDYSRFHEAQSKALGRQHTESSQTEAEAYGLNSPLTQHPKNLQIRTGQEHSRAPGNQCLAPANKKSAPYLPDDNTGVPPQLKDAVAIHSQTFGKQEQESSAGSEVGQGHSHQIPSSNQPAERTITASNSVHESSVALESYPVEDGFQSSMRLSIDSVLEGPSSVRIDR